MARRVARRAAARRLAHAAGRLPDAWTLSALARAENRRPARPTLFHALDHDVCHALRALASGRSFTLAVVLSLAVGIGATTAAFAVVNAALFRPYAVVSQLVEIDRGAQELPRRQSLPQCPAGGPTRGAAS